MGYAQVDRPPLFEEGVRSGVMAAWREQGLPKGKRLTDLFQIDEREEIEPDLWPSPGFRRWPKNLSEVEELKNRLDMDEERRLPSRWEKRVKAWEERQHALMLRVHHGFFESVGIMGWRRFSDVMFQIKTNPALLERLMEIQGDFNARMTERVLSEVQVDAAVFSEPIGANHGPLVSPQVYRELVLPSYQPILDVLRRHGVQTIILRTYANCRVLIPAQLEAGFNCLWAVEVFGDGMDYRDLRNEFGRDLRLIGGIDLDVLHQGRQAVRDEIEQKVLPLLEQGGYAPLADSRVRKDVPWEVYRDYRRLLEQAVCGG